MAGAPNPIEQQRPIEGVKHIISISSGKGGVGKSTMTSNLAIALAKAGKKVGLLDADIYGPSVPRMFGAVNQRPEVTKDNKIIPLERYGVKLMSMGFITEEEAALVWRGPMLFKAMDQMLRDVQWGELDYLLMDLPPGTGDVPLSLAQKVPIAGALVVTTPQNISLIDVKKSIDMFERTGTPIVGMVENMAFFRGPNGEELEMFPSGELDAYLDRKKIAKVARFGFFNSIAKGGEVGIPFMEQNVDSPETAEFKNLANLLIENYQ